MRTLSIHRVHLSVVSAVCFALCVAAVIGFAHGDGKTGVETVPLVWWLVLALCPLLSIGSFVAMFRVKEGSEWWIGVSMLLMIPQAIVGFLVLMGVLHLL
jgi:hypothetical protein